MINAPARQKITGLKKAYETLKPGKQTLLQLLDEAELPELVYNSNPIENATLTLRRSQPFLLGEAVMRNISATELFEGKNLARVTGYLRGKPDKALRKDTS